MKVENILKSVGSKILVDKFCLYFRRKNHRKIKKFFRMKLKIERRVKKLMGKILVSRI